MKLATQLTANTYSQSSSYPGLAAATWAGMNDGKADGSLSSQAGTKQEADAFIATDCGASLYIDRIVVGYDYKSNLPGGWTVTYTEGLLVQGSNDNSTWTTISTLPRYTSTGSTDGLVTVSINQTWRHLRLYRPIGYVCTLEFQVWTTTAPVTPPVVTPPVVTPPVVTPPVVTPPVTPAVPTVGLTPSKFREVEQYLGDRRHAYQSRQIPQPLIRIWDKEMRQIAQVTIPESWDCEEIAHDNGMANIEIVGKDNDWLRELILFKTRPAEDLHVTIDPNPDKPHDWRNRWGGKVEAITDVETAGKPTVTTITAVSNRIHLKHILMAAMPILPHAVQIPKMFLWGGPCVTACATAVMMNLFRIYTLNGFWPTPRNLFDPMSWLNNVSPLSWPVQVMPVRPAFDQSRWITIGSRWKDAETVLTPAMKDAGVICHAYTWLGKPACHGCPNGCEGDPPPYSHVYGESLGNLLKPKRPCTILSFEDQSGVTGPTGTAIDGGLNLFAATLDDIFTEALFPIDDDGDGQTDPFIRKVLGVAPKRPPFVYRDTGYGGVLGRTTVVHKAKAITIVVGGRSPGWVNMAITWGIRYGLSQLAQVISAGPFGAYEAYGAEGLDNLYQGQLDDTLLAFMPFMDPVRSAAVGPYARNEHFEQPGGSAFTMSSVQTARQGWWATRPYTSIKFDIDDSLYRIGEDIRLGSRVSAERRGVIYTDQIMAIKRGGDRNSSGRPIISFGDDSREEDPVAQGFAAISNVANFAAMLASAGDMF